MADRFAVRGALLLDDGLVPGVLVVEAGRIAAVLRGAPDLAALPARIVGAPIVAPGFVELQINGSFGVDLATEPAALPRLAAALPATGVTAFLPTLVSSPAAAYDAALAALAAARGGPGAAPLGLHLEGPFLAPTRAGAHDPAAIAAADDAVLDRCLASGALALVTLAPERPGALARIGRLCAAGVVVALGHTDADFDQTLAAIDAGARFATHAFNAMAALHHRAPGVLGAVLTDDRVTVGLIADGVHLHPAILRLALRAKGAARIALTTDAMAGAGLGPSRYRLGGREVAVDRDSARLADGTLAGSILTMDRAVRAMVEHGHASPADALRMASRVPAGLLGLVGKGVLAVGADADLVLCDETLAVRATYVAGALAYG